MLFEKNFKFVSRVTDVFSPSFDIQQNRFNCVCPSCKKVIPHMMSFKDSKLGVFVCEQCMRQINNDNGHGLCCFFSTISALDKKEFMGKKIQPSF